MSNPDHWNSLASQLGAQVSEQAAAAEQKKPPQTSPSPVRPAVPPTAKKPAPPKPAADWNQLASALGVAPAQPAPPMPAPRANEPRPVEPRAVEPRAVEPRTSERHPSEQRGSEHRAPKQRPPQPPAARERRAPEPPRQRTEPAPEFVTNEGTEFDDEELIEAELVETDEESAAPTAGIGEDERTGRKRRRRRRGGRRSKRDRPRDEGEPSDAPLAESTEDVKPAEEVEFGSDEGDGQQVAAPAEGDREGRPKRRRRRGSGRGRKPSRVADGEPKSTDDSSVEYSLPEAGEEEPEDHEDLVGVGGDFDGGDLDGSDEEGSENQLDKNSHRAIPAWEEAIGYIVSVNMEARAKNPKSGPPRGRRGRGGGRGNSRGGGGGSRRSS